MVLLMQAKPCRARIPSLHWSGGSRELATPHASLKISLFLACVLDRPLGILFLQIPGLLFGSQMLGLGVLCAATKIGRCAWDRQTRLRSVTMRRPGVSWVCARQGSTAGGARASPFDRNPQLPTSSGERRFGCEAPERNPYAREVQI